MAKKRRARKPKVGAKPKRARRNVERVDWEYKESGRKSPTRQAKLEQWEKRQKGVGIFEDFEGRMRTDTESNQARYGPDAPVSTSN